MEDVTVLYQELLVKYQELKADKESEESDRRHKQNLKFLRFISVSERSKAHLTAENKKLRVRIGDLIEVKRYLENQCSELQRLLNEEKRKRTPCVSNLDGQAGNVDAMVHPNERHTANSESAGDDIHDTSHPGSIFQVIAECLSGVKFFSSKREGLSVSALHESSGYSFSLTLIPSFGNMGEMLLYSASSLGTFERVAPEWMREEMMFGTNMCSTFFDRVSKVIKWRC